MIGCGEGVKVCVGGEEGDEKGLLLQLLPLYLGKTNRMGTKHHLAFGGE